MFNQSENQNKWGMFLTYITGKGKNAEIVQNVINERNHNKVKSLEETSAFKKNRMCKKKSKLYKNMKNDNYIKNMNESVRTQNNFSPLKSTLEPRESRNVNQTFLSDPGQIGRENMSKSPVEIMRTITPNDGANKIFLKPITTM